MSNRHEAMKKYKLGEIATISAGQGAPQKSSDYTSQGIPFIKAANLKALSEGFCITEIQKVSSETAKRYNLKLFPAGTIVFAKSGMSCMKGIVYTLPTTAYIVNHLAAVTPINIGIAPYLHFYFQHHKPNKLIKDTSYPSISLTDIANMEIQLPRQEVQWNRVETLSHVNHLIHCYKSLMGKYDELIKARFIEMFGDPSLNPRRWDIVPMSAISDGDASNGFFAKRDEYCSSGNVQILGVANVVNRLYSATDNLPRTNATGKDIEKYQLKYGDMLFCRSSLVAEGIGKASVVPPGISEHILFECHVIRLSLDLSRCVPEYVQVMSTDTYFRNQVVAQSKTSTMTTVSQKGILKCCIPLPPIELQREFLLYIRRSESAKHLAQKALEKAKQLYDSLMQQYFSRSE